MFNWMLDAMRKEIVIVTIKIAIKYGKEGADRVFRKRITGQSSRLRKRWEDEVKKSVSKWADQKTENLWSTVRTSHQETLHPEDIATWTSRRTSTIPVSTRTSGATR